MNTDVLNRQYMLIESWKLFTEKGIYKNEKSQSAEIKLWQQSKLFGANPFQEELFLRAKEPFYSSHRFDEELNEWARKQDVTLYLFNEEKILLDQSKNQLEKFRIEIGAKLDEKHLGITALSLCVKTNEYRCLKGAQNYVKALHYTIMRAYPIQIGESRLYVLSFNHLTKEEESTKNDIGKAIDSYCKRLTDTKNIQKSADTHFDSGIYEIRDTGKVTYTEFSYLSAIPEGENILSVFYNCSISNIFAGKKQIVTYKNNPFKKFIITPISKKERDSALILLETYEHTLQLLDLYHGALNDDASDLLSAGDLDQEDKKRIRALAGSSMPVMFLLETREDQLLLSSYINSQRRDVRHFAVNLDESKGKSSNFYLKMNVISEWLSINERPIIHLFHIESLAMEDVNKIIKECFYTGKKQFKYFFYASMDLYHVLKESFPTILESFKLNIMKLDQAQLQEIRKSMGRLPEGRRRGESNLKGPEENGNPRKNYSLKRIEREAIVNALLASDYNLSKASELLEISRSTLYRKLREYQIDVKY